LFEGRKEMRVVELKLKVAPFVLVRTRRKRKSVVFELVYNGYEL